MPLVHSSMELSGIIEKHSSYPTSGSVCGPGRALQLRNFESVDQFAC
jgi:hypothetical protein